MIESVRIVGVMEDGREKEVRTIPTHKDSVGGVRGFFNEAKEQYVQIMFEDRTFVRISEKELREFKNGSFSEDDDEQQLRVFEDEGGAIGPQTYSQEMQDDLEPIEPAEQDYHEQTLLEKMEDEDE